MAAPLNFWVMGKDGTDRGFEDHWVEVCIGGKEQAAAMFYVRIPQGDDPHEHVRQIGEILASSRAVPGTIIADVLDPGWRERAAAVTSPSPDDDLPF